MWSNSLLYLINVSLITLTLTIMSLPIFSEDILWLHNFVIFLTIVSTIVYLGAMISKINKKKD